MYLPETVEKIHINRRVQSITQKLCKLKKCSSFNQTKEFAFNNEIVLSDLLVRVRHYPKVAKPSRKIRDLPNAILRRTMLFLGRGEGRG